MMSIKPAKCFECHSYFTADEIQNFSKCPYCNKIDETAKQIDNFLKEYVPVAFGTSATATSSQDNTALFSGPLFDTNEVSTDNSNEIEYDIDDIESNVPQPDYRIEKTKQIAGFMNECIAIAFNTSATTSSQDNTAPLSVSLFDTNEGSTDNSNEIEFDIEPDIEYDIDDIESKVPELDHNVFSPTEDWKTLDIVEIPQVTNVIPAGAFANFENMKKLIIPEGVEEIGDFAFHNCQSLVSVQLPDSLVEIGTSAFAECISLEEINLPSKVTKLWATFNGCSSLQDVHTQSHTLKRIGPYTFCNCSSLQYFCNTFSLTEIGEYAFSGCTALGNFSLPNAPIDVGAFAFLNCTALTSVTYWDKPPKSTDIAADTYTEKQAELKSIIESSCQTINDDHNNPFGSDNRPTRKLKLLIKSDVGTKINWCIFARTFKTKNPFLKKSNFDFSDDSMDQFDRYYTNPHFINENCFMNCTAMRSAELPDGITIIQNNAFEGCCTLERIEIPHSVDSLKPNAFIGCHKLNTIEFS